MYISFLFSEFLRRKQHKLENQRLMNRIQYYLEEEIPLQPQNLLGILPRSNTMLRVVKEGLRAEKRRGIIQET